MATDRTVPLSQVELRVTEAGEGGRPLLLVHGFTGVRTDFADYIDRLADRGWHVVAPDQRGHGESDKPTDESAYSFERFASDLLELADALGWPSFAILGHSMGGFIVQVLSLREPERVNALILMDTGHGHVEIDPELAELGASVAREHGMDVVADLAKTIEDPLVTKAYLKKCADDPTYATRADRNTRASSPAMFAAMINEIVNQPSRLEELRTLAMPTLVIVGDQDQPFIPASHDMADAIPNARLAVIPDGGHSPQFEAADAWWAAFSSFLDEVADVVPVPAGDQVRA